MVWPVRGPTQSDSTPRMAMNPATASSAPPLPMSSRADTSPIPAASISRIGCQTRRNCGTEKSYSAWKVERATRNAPARIAWRSNSQRGWVRGVASTRAEIPSDRRISAPTVARPAPPIRSRWVGPHRVTSWPNNRCHTSSSGNAPRANEADTVMSKPPSGAYQSPTILIAVALGRPSFGRVIESTPAKNTPNRPARMK